MHKNFPLLIIDGYNVILRRGLLDEKGGEFALEQARENLLTDLIAYRGDKNIRIQVIFDGQRHPQQRSGKKFPGISCRFSRAPESADDVIKKIINKTENPRSITLVTSDLRLADALRSRQVKHQTVEAFYAQFQPRKNRQPRAERKDRIISRAEVDEWLALFKKSRDRGPKE